MAIVVYWYTQQINFNPPTSCAQRGSHEDQDDIAAPI
jgi:hypothetical protein